MLLYIYIGTLIRERASSSSVVGIAVSCQPYSRAALRWLMQSSIPMAVCIVDAEREPVDAVQYWQVVHRIEILHHATTSVLSALFLCSTTMRFVSWPGLSAWVFPP